MEQMQNIQIVGDLCILQNLIKTAFHHTEQKLHLCSYAFKLCHLNWCTWNV